MESSKPRITLVFADGSLCFVGYPIAKCCGILKGYCHRPKDVEGRDEGKVESKVLHVQGVASDCVFGFVCGWIERHDYMPQFADDNKENYRSYISAFDEAYLKYFSKENLILIQKAGRALKVPCLSDIVKRYLKWLDLQEKNANENTA